VVMVMPWPGGYSVIKSMDDNSLLALMESRMEYLKAIGEKCSSSDSREDLQEKALKVHTYRMIAELFGKAHGYCRGVGGGIHIADFELGHLGANAIVWGTCSHSSWCCYIIKV
jgi:2-oxoisovalerate dehydrogenase E1 component